MKFIISHNGLKRELATPFAMCIGSEDLRDLIRELQQELQRFGGDFMIAWLRIDPSHPSECAPNTVALEWNDPGNRNPPYPGFNKSHE